MNFRLTAPGFGLASLLTVAAAALTPAHAVPTIVADDLGPSPAAGTVWRHIQAGSLGTPADAQLFVERYDMLRTGGTALMGFAGDGVPNHFYAFCLEPLQYIANGATYSVVSVASAPTNTGGMGAAKADLIAELFGRYAPNLAAPMTTLVAGALQIAIWEIERETASTLSVSTGNIYFYNPDSPDGMIELAQTYLSSLNGLGPRAQGLYALINGNLTSGTQDLLVQLVVPEPVSLGVFASGLIVLAAARRRTAN